MVPLDLLAVPKETEIVQVVVHAGFSKPAHPLLVWCCVLQMHTTVVTLKYVTQRKVVLGQSPPGIWPDANQDKVVNR